MALPEPAPPLGKAGKDHSSESVAPRSGGSSAKSSAGPPRRWCAGRTGSAAVGEEEGKEVKGAG